MSDDIRSGQRAKRGRVLVISNPDVTDSSPRGVVEEINNSYPYPSQQNYPSGPYEDRQQPTKAIVPPPLTTNLPPATHGQYPRSNTANQSNPYLSSPSSTSSRAFESTPPPSTPSQSNPPDELSSESTLGQDGVLVSYPDGSEVAPSSASSRTIGFINRMRLPRHLRRPSVNRPTTSPTTPAQDSGPAQDSIAQERITLLVTKDAEHLVTVDVYGVRVRDAAYVRERIFSKLQIPDDEQDRHAFYCTEIGKYAIGEALTDDQLLRLCIERGDERGTIKLLVSDSQGSLYEPLHEPSQPSPTTDPIPTAVLPQNYAPLRPRRSSRSRRDSVSSTSERQPAEASAGYEGSVSDDLDGVETRRPTIRPLQQQQQQQQSFIPSRSQPLPPRPRSPSGYGRSQSPGGLVSPDRNPSQASYHSPISLRNGPRASGFPNGTVTSPDMARYQEAIQNGGTALWGTHIRSGSDVAGDRERTLQSGEPTAEYGSHRRFRDMDERDRTSPEKARSPNSAVRERTPGLRRAKATAREQRYDTGWSMVPSNVHSNENGHGRPSPVHEPHLSPSRQGIGSPYAQLQIPRPPHVPLPPAPSDPRPHGKSRAQKNVVPRDYVIRYKDAPTAGRDPMPQSPPRQSYGINGAKSMGDLRSMFNAQGPSYHPTPPPRRPANLPMSISQRPSTSDRSNEITIPIQQELSNNSDAGIAKSYEGPRGPLSSPTVSSLSSRPAGPPNHPAYNQSIGNHSTPSQDPYPRPHSSLGNDPATVATSPYRSNRVLNGEHFSPDIPYRPLVPVPPSTSYRDEHSVPSFGPRPPRYQHDTFGGTPRVTRTPPRSPVNAKSPGSGWAGTGLGTSPDAPQQVQRTLSSLPLQEDEVPSSTESTLRRDDMSRFYDAIGSGTSVSGSSTVVPSTSRQAPPPARPPSPPRSYDSSISFPASLGSTPEDLLINTNSDESDSEAGTIWAKAPHKLPISHSNRPFLPPIDTDSSPNSRNQPLPRDNPRIPANFPPPPGYIPDTPPVRAPRRTAANSKKLQDQRTSRFDNNFEVTWAPRPPPEEVFERLQEYFPEHDIDEPVIDMPSGGTSPTSAEPNVPLPAEKQKFRHKKSIRLVAEEHKKRVDRRSRMEPATNASNVLRKRNTKLWGSRLEEVPTHDQALLADAGPSSDVSPGPAKPIFRWVRGEMIGKGTYGKVYLALNATTGEMIAVKQVEMPRTASDRDDSRQVSVVEALKLESETLKDLDHPNIVQYLGFEETPTFLSIFLEYVPGGSIASCLRKHGKFDEEVTKSFTGQILGGLEYLHSKGILHRDMKCDNILVETTGICKISDFGISKRTDDINMAGAYTSMQGTVFWMAPEVIDANKKGYNSKIDIWSVGCVVFEMWTGQRPWSGREAMAVLLQLYQTKQGPPVPQEVILSPLADDFRQKCFAMDPDERPTAAELRNHPYLELQPDWVFNGFK